METKRVTAAAPAPTVAHDVGVALRELAESAIELLYPFECLACGGGGAPASLPGLCRGCDDALPRRDPQRPPHLRQSPRLDGGGVLPAAHVAAHVVALELAPPASDLVYQLKYGGAVAAALPLAGALEQAVRARGLERRVELLAPVPAHWLKVWLRGVDHASALTEELARALELPSRRLLGRRFPTVAQGQARSGAERARQVAGAFTVRSRRRVKGRSIGLVDDVVTSGATAEECARVLLAAGAREVILFAAVGNG